MTWYHETVINYDPYIYIAIEEIDIVKDHASFCVRYKSQRFAGWHAFLMHVDDIRHLLEQLEKMEAGLCGEAIFIDVNTNAYLKFIVIEDKIKVAGLLGDSRSDYMLKLDPSGCYDLIKPLQGLLKEALKEYWYA